MGVRENIDRIAAEIEQAKAIERRAEQARLDELARKEEYRQSTIRTVGEYNAVIRDLELQRVEARKLKDPEARNRLLASLNAQVGEAARQYPQGYAQLQAEARREAGRKVRRGIGSVLYFIFCKPFNDAADRSIARDNAKAAAKATAEEERERREDRASWSYGGGD